MYKSLDAQTTGRVKRKLISAAVTVAVVGLLGTGTASASHVHSKQVGNGGCVLLAQKGGEKNVILPHSEAAANRSHPLHLNVHLGRPGQNFAIGVHELATDPCLANGNYLND